MFNAFALMVQVFGGGLVVDAVTTATKGTRSQSWPKVSGRILSSGVRVLSGAGGGQEGGGVPSVLAGPDLSYEYEVEGQRYTGSVVSFAGTRPTFGGANEIAELYPAGASVTVWYDPEDPECAVLEPGAGNVPYVQMILGVGLIAGGMVFLFTAGAS